MATNILVQSELNQLQLMSQDKYINCLRSLYNILALVQVGKLKKKHGTKEYLVIVLTETSV